MPLKIAIVDYGMGNLHSVYRKLAQLEVVPVVTANAEAIRVADKIILPGVGHFAKAMNNLKSSGLYDVLNEAVLERQKPILGICLGMQLMARHSEEGGETGFGWLNATVSRFNVQDKLRYKIPQTGWNTVAICKTSRLFQGIPDGSEFYFLHAYHYQAVPPADILTKTEYEYEFVSAVEKENVFGTQFHPEKSHRAGLQLLKNFIQL